MRVYDYAFGRPGFIVAGARTYGPREPGVFWVNDGDLNCCLPGGIWAVVPVINGYNFFVEANLG